MRLDLASNPNRTTSPDPEASATLREQTEAVRRALTALPSRQVEVVCLVFAEEMTVEEAAEVMGISVGSARTHYHRAKKRIVELMGDEE